MRLEMFKTLFLRLILKSTPQKFSGATKSYKNLPLTSHQLSKSLSQESCPQRGLNLPGRLPNHLLTTHTSWWSTLSYRPQRKLSSPLCTPKSLKTTSRQWQNKKRLRRSEFKTKLTTHSRRCRVIRTCSLWSRRSICNYPYPRQTFLRWLNRQYASNQPVKTKKRPPKTSLLKAVQESLKTLRQPRKPERLGSFRKTASSPLYITRRLNEWCA